MPWTGYLDSRRMSADGTCLSGTGQGEDAVWAGKRKQVKTAKSSASVGSSTPLALIGVGEKFDPIKIEGSTANGSRQSNYLPRSGRHELNVNLGAEGEIR